MAAVSGDDPVFLRSYDAGSGEGPNPEPALNGAFTYDNALAVIALRACGDLRYAAVVVLGHAEYYPRFGFIPASRFGLRCEYEVPDDVFMAMELTPGALQGSGPGTIRYHAAFGSV